MSLTWDQTPKGHVIVTAVQRAVLDRLVRAYTTPHHLAQRARIVLMSAEGTRNVDQAAVLGTDPQRIRRWRRRWADAQAAIAAAEVAEGEGAYVDMRGSSTCRSPKLTASTSTSTGQTDRHLCPRVLGCV